MGCVGMQKSTACKKGDLVKHKMFRMGRMTEDGKAGRDFKLKINFGGMRREIMARLGHTSQRISTSFSLERTKTAPSVQRGSREKHG